jgi:hypothetical protein
MSRSLEDQMLIEDLNFKLTNCRVVVSRSINIMELISIALDEDDIDEARRIIKEALGENE